MTITLDEVMAELERIQRTTREMPGFSFAEFKAAAGFGEAKSREVFQRLHEAGLVEYVGRRVGVAVTGSPKQTPVFRLTGGESMAATKKSGPKPEKIPTRRVPFEGPASVGDMRDRFRNAYKPGKNAPKPKPKKAK